jgi:hypothetical protein
MIRPGATLLPPPPPEGARPIWTVAQPLPPVSDLADCAPEAWVPWSKMWAADVPAPSIRSFVHCAAVVAANSLMVPSPTIMHPVMVVVIVNHATVVEPAAES